jgi:hypothetical protein
MKLFIFIAIALASLTNRKPIKSGYAAFTGSSYRQFEKNISAGN